MPRSPALTIETESGEPYLLATQENRDPWLLVLYHERKRVRKGKKYRYYSLAKKAKKEMDEKYPQDQGWEVCIVSRQVGYGPPYSKITDRQIYLQNIKGLLWCPYCRTFREFLWDPKYEVKRCPVCRCMASGFHIQVNNPSLWDKDKREREGVT